MSSTSVPIADDPEQYLGRHVGDSEHCVSLVRHAAGLGDTSTWRRGVRVLDAIVPPGAIIATFTDEGRYANATDGSSHVAIFQGETRLGALRVIDQWTGQPAIERLIHDNYGAGRACDDASRYHVVEVA